MAALARGTSVAKAAEFYKKAVDNDPADSGTWDSYARVLVILGRTGDARTAFEQAALKARDADSPRLLFWATVGLGDIARVQGDLPSADRLAKSAPGNTTWQRDMALAQNKIGDVLLAQANLPAALEAFYASRAISERLAGTDPGNASWQRDRAVFHGKIGDVLVAQGALPAALQAYNTVASKS